MHERITHHTMTAPPLHTELALRAFEADQAFSAALAACQAKLPAGIGPIQAARAANAHGFSWISRPAHEPGLVEVRLRHAAGADVGALGTSVSELLAGLLGLTLDRDGVALEPVAQASDPEIMQKTHSASVEAAAESLAQATGGQVFEVDEPAPDPITPLSDEQRAVAVEMVKQLTAEQRKAFTIAYRDAFRVDRAAKSIIPTITQLQHLAFIDRFTVEANGGISE